MMNVIEGSAMVPDFCPMRPNSRPRPVGGRRTTEASAAWTLLPGV